MVTSSDCDYKNTSYIFIPVDYSGMVPSDEQKSLAEDEKEDFGWEKVDDNIKYMLKYVSDKFDSQKDDVKSPKNAILNFASSGFDSSDKENCLCYHFRLRKDLSGANKDSFGNDIRLRTDSIGNDVILHMDQKWYQTSKSHDFKGQEIQYRFKVHDVDLFCFSTCVCIMAFRIEMEESDPFWISSAQYYLKKVSREEISFREDETKTTFLEVADALFKRLGLTEKPECFYYANDGEERANLLSYIEMEGNKNKKDCLEELYYLRHCYDNSYIYIEDAESEQREIYQSTGDVIWGVSAEAAVCLAFPDMDQSDFIHDKLYPNFNTQYLFMYVMLLHQKYFLYSLLTRIGVGAANDIEQLEVYENQLYEFETDFVYTFVTEVPQYQQLYERMFDAFAINEMFKDVREPLVSLGRKRKEEEEKEENARNKELNTLLGFIAILAVFSALVDSFDFFGSFLPIFISREQPIFAIQVICVGVVGVIAVFVIVRFIKNIRKKRKK